MREIAFRGKKVEAHDFPDLWKYYPFVKDLSYEEIYLQYPFVLLHTATSVGPLYFSTDKGRVPYSYCRTSSEWYSGSLNVWDACNKAQEAGQAKNFLVVLATLRPLIAVSSPLSLHLVGSKMKSGGGMWKDLLTRYLNQCTSSVQWEVKYFDPGEEEGLWEEGRVKSQSYSRLYGQNEKVPDILVDDAQMYEWEPPEYKLPKNYSLKKQGNVTFLHPAETRLFVPEFERKENRFTSCKCEWCSIVSTISVDFSQFQMLNDCLALLGRRTCSQSSAGANLNRQSQLLAALDSGVCEVIKKDFPAMLAVASKICVQAVSKNLVEKASLQNFHFSREVGFEPILATSRPTIAYLSKYKLKFRGYDSAKFPYEFPQGDIQMMVFGSQASFLPETPEFLTAEEASYPGYCKKNKIGVFFLYSKILEQNEIVQDYPKLIVKTNCLPQIVFDQVVRKVCQVRRFVPGNYLKVKFGDHFVCSLQISNGICNTSLPWIYRSIAYSMMSQGYGFQVRGQEIVEGIFPPGKRTEAQQFLGREPKFDSEKALSITVEGFLSYIKLNKNLTFPYQLLLKDEEIVKRFSSETGSGKGKKKRKKREVKLKLVRQKLEFMNEELKGVQEFFLESEGRQSQTERF